MTTSSRSATGWVTRSGALVCWMLLFAGAVALGHALSAPPATASLWPGTGLLLGALLVRPTKEWLWIASLAALAHFLFYVLLFGGSTAVGLALYCALPAVEALTSATILHLLFPEAMGLSGSRQVLTAAGVGALLVPALSALFAPYLVARPEGEFWSIWQVWWFGDGLGVLTVTPVVVYIAGDLFNGRRDWPEFRSEALLILAVVIATTLLVFTKSVVPGQTVTDFPYFLFPPLIWAALRLEPRLVATSGLAIALMSAALTVQGYGPFVRIGTGPREQVLALQAFLAVTVFSVLILSLVVSERKRATERRMAVERQLEQSQKMEAIGQLAGGIAHDFNNLLTVIQGNLEIAREQSPVSDHHDDPTSASLAEADLATERAAALTRQLLVFSRREPRFPEVLEMNELLKGVEPLLRRLIGEHISIEVRANREPFPVKVDRSQIEQVFLNLAINARDAMPAGGRLSIGLARVPVDESPGPGDLDRDHVVVSVSDTGSGIPPEAIPHVFEPFFTTKVAGKGTGLGLATVHTAISESGGWVTVESVPDEGSTFFVYLPITLENSLDDPVLQAPLKAGNETILVCEDESEVRPLLKKALEDGGYQVLSAGHPDEAIRVAESEPGIALLLTDVVMPGMNGFDLAARLREDNPTMAALYLSGYPSAEFESRAGEVDVAQVIRKPVRAAVLRQRVRQALDKSQR